MSEPQTPTECTATRTSSAASGGGSASSTASFHGPWKTSWRIGAKLYDGVPDFHAPRPSVRLHAANSRRPDMSHPAMSGAGPRTWPSGQVQRGRVQGLALDLTQRES